MTYNNLTILDQYVGNIDDLQITIYSSDEGLVKKCTFKGQSEWLQIGENTYDLKLHTTGQPFPILDFSVLEAKKYGYIIPCGYLDGIPSYSGLSCDPWNLKKLKSEEKYDAIGYYKSIDLFICKDCAQQWVICEEYDSHRGKNRKCIKKLG